MPEPGTAHEPPTAPASGESASYAAAPRRDWSGLAPATIVVAAGRPPHEPDAPLNPPVVLASTFRAGGRIEYARETTPTGEALEEVLGALEGGTATVFGSGMAAVNAVLDLVPPGGLVVAPDHVYTGVSVRLAELAEAGRLRLRRVPAEATVAAAGDDDLAVLWLESPTNPMLEVVDISAAAAAARGHGALVVCDSTFATPLGQHPLALGADVVLHSATKFIGGHSDLLLGAVVAADPALAERLRVRRVLLGAAPGALECYLALRGLRTLALRLDRGQSTAALLAGRLAGHGAVSTVRYPGLPGHPGHAIAARQMTGFGAMLSIDTIGTADDADAVCRAVRLWTHATSLGGVESLLERRRRWAREAADVPATLIRLSVGIEDPEDLWADLSQALDTLLLRG